MNLPVALNKESLAAWRQVYKLLRHSELMAHSAGFPNDALLATIISSQSLGHSSLPPDFGLGQARLAAMAHRHFPKLSFILPESWTPTDPLPEHQELVNLLLRYRAGLDESEYDIAVIVATACRGKDHLWQDLGLNNRKELSDLFQRNFPRLAAKNNRDMKWKKFLYKQLCEEEGIYVCRAPSCAECKDQPECFGPEQ
ncbi:nitrogen fixation protein NifQ [Formivibrio citricus]|uniref:Nitrogen fixation protein NifQ n=1 Tax=Formivibrio citricus TaxID=83765 RepID=A0A1I4YVM7_9NEIS|nr:nitrogen fixation protein NifQ [Formivibrio citricus]SFN42106.1 nitrogen fixation protein NifQ [Formivibrio citricus]